MNLTIFFGLKSISNKIFIFVLSKSLNFKKKSTVLFSSPDLDKLELSTNGIIILLIFNFLHDLIRLMIFSNILFLNMEFLLM